VKFEQVLQSKNNWGQTSKTSVTFLYYYSFFAHPVFFLWHFRSRRLGILISKKLLSELSEFWKIEMTEVFEV